MSNRKQRLVSAKSLVLDDEPSAKSLMYIKNNNGPRVEPWGVPALTLVHEEDYPFNTTFCFLCVKKNFKTFNKVPDITFSCNFNKTIKPDFDKVYNPGVQPVRSQE